MRVVDVTRLSDRLNQAKDAVDLNVDAAVLRAQEAGFSIDRSIAYKALKGNRAKKPTDDTLRGFEAVFGVPVTELRKLLELPAGELEPYKPPAYANRLSRDQRKALNNLIRTIVESTVAVTEEPGDVTDEATVTHLPAPAKQTRRAARKGTPNLPD